MATNFRRTKLERFVNQLKEDLPEYEKLKADSDPHGMGLYYEGVISEKKRTIAKLTKEFKLKESEVNESRNIERGHSGY